MQVQEGAGSVVVSRDLAMVTTWVQIPASAFLRTQLRERRVATRVSVFGEIVPDLNYGRRSRANEVSENRLQVVQIPASARFTEQYRRAKRVVCSVKIGPGFESVQSRAAQRARLGVVQIPANARCQIPTRECCVAARVRYDHVLITH